MCRGEAATERHIKGIAGESSDNPIVVNAIAKNRGARPKTSGRYTKPASYGQKGSPPEPQKKQCKYCGYKHLMLKSHCKAVGKTCSSCSQQGHFSSCCPQTKKFGRGVHAIDAAEVDQVEDTAADNYVHHLRDNSHTPAATSIYAQMLVQNKPVRFQLDTGSAVSILPLALVPDGVTLKPSTKVLRTYDGTKLSPAGTVMMTLVNPQTQQQHPINFEVVRADHMPLLGASAVLELNLLTINESNFVRVDAVNEGPLPTTKSAILDNYAAVFDNTLGNLPGPPVHLQLDPTVQPIILPARKLPLAMEQPVKSELARLVDAGVLEPVDKPTRWVNQMSVVERPNGKLRICLDPRGLNSALMREHHTLPTLDTMLHKVQGAKVFSKADLRNGFWHLSLDEESSDLTVMATPFGRYRWRRLPFGLNTSSEIFYKRIQAAFRDMDNVHVVADDALICGYGPTVEAAHKDHDQALVVFMNRCLELNIALNPEKFTFKAKQIPFLGHVLTEHGIQPDPEKVRAIVDMPLPSDVSGVRHLCGCMNYLARYVPHLADLSRPLHELTSKGAVFAWEPHHTTVVEKMKQAITSAPVLAYFDTNAPITVQCDSSESGMGAVLLQRGRPVAYMHVLINPAQGEASPYSTKALE